jgi:hypothetical protein
MTYFDENGEYWGNKSKPIINGGNGRLGARSVKIFADGIPFITFQLHISHTPTGALRSGGAAVRKYDRITCASIQQGYILAA